MPHELDARGTSATRTDEGVFAAARVAAERLARPLRILCVASELPYPPDTGAKTRIYSLLRHLASAHHVGLIAFERDAAGTDRAEALRRVLSEVITVPLSERQRSGKRWSQLRSLGSRHSYNYLAQFSPAMQRAIDAYLATHSVDVVQIEGAQMGYYSMPAGVPTVLTEHNVEHEILYRSYRAVGVSLRKLYNYLEWRKVRRDELAMCANFALCVTTSERDRQTLASLVPNARLAVVPNGVDLSYFAPDAHDGQEAGGTRAEGQGPLPEDHTILFTGTLGYYPNVDGVRYFVEQVLPLIRRDIPAARLLVVGKAPPPEIQAYGRVPGVVVTGEVPDVRPYFRQAVVAVVPLRVGGGTRLKILEAMAMRRPVVSTSVGAEGLEVMHGENILIADEPRQIAQSVVTLLRDGELRARLAAGGRHLVEGRYDWGPLASRLGSIYEDLLGSATDPSPAPGRTARNSHREPMAWRRPNV